jgi:predicted MFS family arabinose efflux permease
MGVAAVFGQLIGGLLIRANVFGSGWRSCFLINLPVAVGVLVLLPRLIPESRSPGRPHLDLPGAALITSAIALVVLPLIDGRAQGWPSWTWLSFTTAAVLFVCFWARERRLAAGGSDPLVHPDLFRERAFTVGLLAQLVFWMGQASFFLVFALYVQQGRGLSALGAGTIFTAVGAGYLGISLSAHKFTRRMGRQVLAVGGATMAAGLGALAAVVAHVGTGGNIGLLIPGLVLDGAGMGLVIAPLTTTVLAQVSTRYAGTGAGVMSTAVQIGNALGVAVIGIIFYSALGTAATVAAYAHALLASVVYLILIGLALALLVQFLPRAGQDVA